MPSLTAMSASSSSQGATTKSLPERPRESVQCGFGPAPLRARERGDRYISWFLHTDEPVNHESRRCCQSAPLRAGEVGGARSSTHGLPCYSTSFCQTWAVLALAQQAERAVQLQHHLGRLRVRVVVDGRHRCAVGAASRRPPPDRRSGAAAPCVAPALQDRRGRGQDVARTRSTGPEKITSAVSVRSVDHRDRVLRAVEGRPGHFGHPGVELGERVAVLAGVRPRRCSWRQPPLPARPGRCPADFQRQLPPLALLELDRAPARRGSRCPGDPWSGLRRASARP